MPAVCCLEKYKKTLNLRGHKFPKDLVRRKKWIEANVKQSCLNVEEIFKI